MSEVQELKDRLEKAQKEQKDQERKKNFEHYKAYYEGKAFASHKLASSKHSDKALYFTMYKLTNFRTGIKEWDKTIEYLFDVHNITYNRYSDQNVQTNYGISKASTDTYFNGYGNMNLREKYIISVEQFDMAYKQAIAGLELAYNEIRSAIKFEQYITNGDHTTERNELQYLIDAKVPLINLKDFPKLGHISILELLSWNHHPFVIADHLINSQASKLIAINLADKMEESAKNWGSSIAERDLPRVRQIRSFINQVSWES